MKYLKPYTWRVVCCERCGLGGLTLTKKSDKLYVHETEIMCEIAKLRKSAKGRKIHV